MTTGSTRGFNQAGVVTHYDDVVNPEHQTDLWRTCPTLAILCNPKIATVYDETFRSYDATDDWTLTQQTTGTAAISTAAPGVLEIDSNSTTATQGVNLQNLNACFIPAANKSIWYEARVKVVDTYDKAELFIGLANSDTTIIGTSAVSTTDHIGFSCVTDDGVLLFNCEKAGVGTTGTGTTLAEATYVDLGFHYDGVADTAQAYVNGVAVGSAITTTNIPKLAIFPSFVCQSGGTNDPILHVQGFRCVQLK
jgi:hypothetical protein